MTSNRPLPARFSFIMAFLVLAACGGEGGPLAPEASQPVASDEPPVLGSFVQVLHGGHPLPVIGRDPLLAAPAEGLCYDLPDSSRVTIERDSLSVSWWGRLECVDGIRDATGGGRFATRWKAQVLAVIDPRWTTTCTICFMWPCQTECASEQLSHRIAFRVSGDSISFEATPWRSVATSSMDESRGIIGRHVRSDEFVRTFP